MIFILIETLKIAMDDKKNTQHTKWHFSNIHFFQKQMFFKNETLFLISVVLSIFMSLPKTSQG